MAASPQEGLRAFGNAVAAGVGVGMAEEQLPGGFFESSEDRVDLPERVPGQRCGMVGHDDRGLPEIDAEGRLQFRPARQRAATDMVE